jgi:hypothetical protein
MYHLLHLFLIHQVLCGLMFPPRRDRLLPAHIRLRPDLVIIILVILIPILVRKERKGVRWAVRLIVGSVLEVQAMGDRLRRLFIDS